jgi:hypothetical protein
VTYLSGVGLPPPQVSGGFGLSGYIQGPCVTPSSHVGTWASTPPIAVGENGVTLLSLGQFIDKDRFALRGWLVMRARRITLVLLSRILTSSSSPELLPQRTRDAGRGVERAISLRTVHVNCGPRDEFKYLLLFILNSCTCVSVISSSRSYLIGRATSKPYYSHFSKM